LDAAHRRLSDELGIKKVTLEYVYKFSYTAEYKNIGSENELCSVFIGKIDEDLDINENEISLVKYIDTRDLLCKMKNNNEYTPWFEMEWNTLLTSYQKTLRQYTNI
jgi:isopentenyl-diphosphate delta-isomerase